MLRKLRTLREKGLRWCLFCQLPALGLRGLRKVYPFHVWHADNPSGCRPYKRFVADLVSSLSPAVAVEVGCGLGDIIAMVRAAERHGIDPDRAAISAARIAHPLASVQWAVGDLATAARLPRIDVLLAIGWVHEVSREYLREQLAPLLGKTRYVIVDEFVGDPGIQDFSWIGERIKTTTPPEDNVRRYFVYAAQETASR